MALDPSELAKKALIAYRQLSEIVKDHIGVTSAIVHSESYNQILDTLNHCFAIDKTFEDSVKHLHHLQEGTPHLSYKMESDGKVLLATAHSFIEMYMSPEEKKKTFGFHT